jgi:hypothetical protein
MRERSDPRPRIEVLGKDTFRQERPHFFATTRTGVSRTTLYRARQNLLWRRLASPGRCGARRRAI